MAIRGVASAGSRDSFVCVWQTVLKPKPIGVGEDYEEFRTEDCTLPKVGRRTNSG